MNKPDYVGISDWKALQNKYHNKIPTKILKKINENYPIQYLIGNVEFFNTSLLVNKNVLIPRYETELFVDKIIKLINKEHLESSKIIDLGTGSGAIAINVAKYFNIKVNVLDNSKKALKVAKKNAKINKVKLKYYKKDILKDKIEFNYNIIISNPPYVGSDEVVDPKTKYEPKEAIYAKNNGLEFYERIINLVQKNQTKEFWLLFEIGESQAQKIITLVKKTFKNFKIILEKDMNGKDRYLFFKINIINE